MELVQRQINQEGLSPNLQHRESTLRRELEERNQKEEIILHQKSRILWLKEGEKNTKFFHNSLLQRKGIKLDSLFENGRRGDGQKERRH
jgi:hypothetical protein